MKYLWDTNTLIYWLNGDTRVEALRLQRGSDNIGLCWPVVLELVLCTSQSTNVERNIRNAVEVIAAFQPILESDGAVMDRFCALRAQFKAKATPKPEMDVLIAAHALVHDLTLVTSNGADFEGTPDLRIEDWRSSSR